MEHVRLPVSAGRGMLFEVNSQGLPVPLADVYCEGRLGGETGKTREIADALNQHDALVAAVQAKQALMDHIVFCTTCGTGAMCDDYHPLYIDEEAKRAAALNLIQEGE